MSASLCTLKEGMSYTKQLPSKGLSQSQVVEKIKEYETLSKSAFFPERHASLSVKLQSNSFLCYKNFLDLDNCWQPVVVFLNASLRKPPCFQWQDVLLQVRCSGTRDVFRVQCTGVISHWPISWWRFVSLITFLNIPSTKSHDWISLHFDVNYSTQDSFIVFVFKDRSRLSLKVIISGPVLFKYLEFM